VKKLFLLTLLITSIAFSQNRKKAFQNGEFLKYRISYGLLNAGFATLQLEETKKDDPDLFHIKGRGWSTGVVNVFFPVEDDYQSYFDKETQQPARFIRKIREGGYTKNKEIFFDFSKQKARVLDHKNGKEDIFSIDSDAFDMLSAFYYFRNMDLTGLKKGEIVRINLFYDDRMNLVELQYIGKEVIRTRFGKIRTIVFKPLVEEGRVFSDKESVLVWFTDDRAKIPVRIKAAILVGSVKFELHEVKNITGRLPLVF
jgi:hypothetical protein